MDTRDPVLIVAGTRPEVIKLAPVYFAATARFGDHMVEWVSTGQHRALEQAMLRGFGIASTHSLDARAVDAPSLSDVISRIADGIGDLVRHRNPSMVLVQGDTASAYAAAIAAFHAGTPVAHVEAGLRTYDNLDPYPEEAYRRMIDVLATIRFAPTAAAAAHLRAEGCAEESIYVTGNTVVDSLALIDARSPRPVPAAVMPDATAGTRHLLVTLHRRESWGDRLRDMCGAIRDIADRFEDVHIVFPLHVNPIVRDQVRPLLSNHPRIALVEPLDYSTCHLLIRGADLILTDSGGIQEEAPSYGVPILVLRRRTERTEALEAGAAILVGTDRDRIVTEAGRLLSDRTTAKGKGDHRNPFGDGCAAARIALALERFLNGHRILLSADEQFGAGAPCGAAIAPGTYARL